jgi:UDP-N-acetyl-D-mannosaminuronate dehydrogenase
LGTVGKWFYDFISKKEGYDVQTLDIEEKEIIKPIDVMHVCIPYFDKFVKVVSDYIMRYEPGLVVIHSTVIPSTTRRIFDETGAPVVHSPVRGNGFNFTKWKQYVGGIKVDAIKDAREYLSELGFEVEVLDNPETTEFGKLFDTTFYAVCIAWHQEMDRYCKKYDISYEQAVLKFSSTFVLDPWYKIQRPLLWAGVIEKECLIPNAWLLLKMKQCEMIECILRSNTRRSVEVYEEGLKDRVERQREFAKRLWGAVNARGTSIGA